MTIQVTVEVPKAALFALKEETDDLGAEVLLAASVKWFESGIISQEKAAEIAGLSREDFIDSLARYQTSPFQYTIEEIQEEFERG